MHAAPRPPDNAAPAPALRSTLATVVLVGRLAAWALLLLWLLGVEGNGELSYHAQQGALQQAAVAAHTTAQLLFGPAVALCADRLLALLLLLERPRP